MTRDDLAQLIGLAPTHLRRTLHLLRDQQLISFERGRAKLHRPDDVLAIAKLDSTAAADGGLF